MGNCFLNNIFDQTENYWNDCGIYHQDVSSCGQYDDETYKAATSCCICGAYKFEEFAL